MHWKLSKILFSVLILAILFFQPSYSSNPVKREPKLNPELKTIEFLGQQELFVWIDINATVDSYGEYYLPADPSIYGINWKSITYAPDLNQSRLFWCLAQVQANKIQDLLDIPWVYNITLMNETASYNEQIDSRLSWGFRETLARSIEHGGELQVILFLSDDCGLTNHESSPNEDSLKKEAIGNLTMTMEHVGGRVLKDKNGDCGSLLVALPAKSIENITCNPIIRKVDLNGPIIFSAEGGNTILSCVDERSGFYRVIAFMLVAAVWLAPTCAAGQRTLRKKKVFTFLATIIIFVSLVTHLEFNPAYALNTSTSAIRATDVWATGNRGEGVNVAIIDSGIDMNHPDFPNAIVDRINIHLNSTNVQDINGHGTHVAGIVAGRGIQNPAYRGVAPSAGIVVVKMVDNYDQLQAVRWIRDHRVQDNIGVIQSSVRPTGTFPKPGDGLDTPYAVALDDAVDDGIVVIQAVGNEGNQGAGSVIGPACAFNVITVGSVDDRNTPSISDDVLWSDSSRGPTADGRPKPDIVAPGTHIISCRATGTDIRVPGVDTYIDDFYVECTGTSMAAPHVSGTAALMLHANPNLTPAQVRAILRQTARLNDNLNGLSLNDRGHGIIDAYGAVQAVSSGDIHADQMYDSWAASTPSRDLGWGFYDYLTFTISPPSTQGISMENIEYHEKWLITPINDYSLLRQAYTRDVWIDGTYYNLGADMSEYLLSGPRVYEKGDGYLKLQAWYKIGTVSIRYDWYMHVNAQTFGVEYSGGSSLKTTIYLNPEIGYILNYGFLPSSSQTMLIESKMTDQPLDIRALGYGEYVQIYPENTATMWLLKHGYVGNNPDDAMNNEYIYNRDIDVYYQTTSQSPAVTTWRRTDQLPAPSNAQNDAGSGGDAGNSFAYGLWDVQPGSYTGILCNSDPSDTQDWYVFYVDSGYTVIVYMSPPPGIDFDLELYDQSYQLKPSCHNGPGIPEAVGCDNCQAGWWRARIYTISGEAQYSFSVSVKEGQTPRCPYVSAWDGQRYVMDNNLLPTSLKNNGTDVEDYYKLEQSLVPTYRSRSFLLYQLQISEFENEHSYIDQVKLLAVEHSADCNIAVTPEGEILTYRQPQPPISCVDNNGTNTLSQTQFMDGNVSDPSTYFDGYKGDYLVLNFGQITSQNAKLILRSDRKCYDTGAYPPCCIQVQILNNSQWQTVSVVAPREYWSTEAVNLSQYIVAGQDLTVRLYWTMPHRLDYVGLDTSPQENFEIHNTTLISAIHSTEGDVTRKLLKDDEVYAELVPGQQMRLTFLMPNNQDQNEDRTFIFYTEGHYNTIS